MNDCWLYAGFTNRQGYGQISSILNGQKVTNRIHRLMYESVQGPIPEGLVLDHLCKVTTCINPDHLEAVTQQINIYRGTSPTAIHRMQTHCANGHEWTVETIRWEKDRKGKRFRRCVPCQRKNANAHYARKRMAI
jgi:hypothetical protein